MFCDVCSIGRSSLRSAAHGSVTIWVSESLRSDLCLSTMKLCSLLRESWSEALKVIKFRRALHWNSTTATKNYFDTYEFMNVTSLNKKMSNQSAVYNRNIAQRHFSSETFLEKN